MPSAWREEGIKEMCERPGVGSFRDKLKSKVNKRYRIHLRA